MILCVTPNAAIDKTLLIANYQLDHIHRPQEVITLGGGKGCNVARVLARLGVGCMVTGWVGGHAGNFIEESLKAEGIQPRFVKTAQESRECISVIDTRQGTLTEIYENGKPVTKEEQEKMIDLYERLLPSAALVALCGSLPPQLPPDFYATLIQMANRGHTPVFLDASGTPLRAGLEGGQVALVKPNLSELGQLAGRPLQRVEEVIQQARRLAERFETTFVVSLGAEGAVLVSPQHSLRALPLAVEAVSAVGSGDAMLAGLASAFLEEQTWETALRRGSALGAANALQPGAGRFHMEDFEQLLSSVEIEGE